MTKARLVITAVVTEGWSQEEVARVYRVSQRRISRLFARYREVGEVASSRGPGSDHQLAQETVRAGPGRGRDIIIQHLEHYKAKVPTATVCVNGHLLRAGLVTPEPRKRPKSTGGRLQPHRRRVNHAGTSVLLIVRDLQIWIINVPPASCSASSRSSSRAPSSQAPSWTVCREAQGSALPGKRHLGRRQGS
jgi:hypothetical protein